MTDLTTLLRNMREGDRAAAEQVMQTVYRELRRLAAHYLRNERREHTLQATALVHEVYLRLFGADEPISCNNRAHFFAIAAQQMRRILVDHARALHASKRGGVAVRVSLTQAKGLSGEDTPDLLSLEECLCRLEQLDPRAAKVVELRFFGGLHEKEAAEVVGISVATLKRDWDFARTWILSQLTAR